MKTETGSNWNLSKPVRSSLFQGEGELTGNVEYHNTVNGRECMLEVDHGFGIDFIFEDFLSQ